MARGKRKALLNESVMSPPLFQSFSAGWGPWMRLPSVAGNDSDDSGMG